MAIVTYQKTNKTKLTKNFAINEFACKGSGCCSIVKIDTELAACLQKVRDHFGKAVIITSGYRCPTHNRAVGGSTNSYHARGMAADIQVKGVAPIEVAKFLESIGMLGIGLYSNFVHVDTRKTKFFWYGHEQSTRSTFGSKVETTKTSTMKIDYTQKDFIKDLQKIFGLAQTGVADQKLLNKTVTLSRIKNYRHAAVRPVQKYLYALGYTDIANSTTDPDKMFDGIAGKKFDTVVKRYQADVVHPNDKRKADGEITAGHKTWKKILGMK